MKIDPKLREFATQRQLEYFDAIERAGHIAGAARALNLTRATLQEAIKIVSAKAAKQGYAPGHFESGTAPGFNMGKVTVQRGPAGEVERTWERQSPDMAQREELVRQMIAAMTEDLRGLSPVIKAPKVHDSNLMTVIPVGDPHYGLQVWGEECGADFDLKIAKRLTTESIDRLIERTPSSAIGMMILLGDTFHMNDQTNATPRSKHQLDVDGRFVKVLRVATNAQRHTVLRLLQKHKHVIIKVVPGNHDPEASWALAFTLHAFFEGEPRVTVCLEPAPMWYYRFGKVLIGSTHGDKVKHSQLGAIMAADRPKDWGNTLYRYWYTGHVHSQNVTETPGVICESFRTLAAGDSYATSHGYRAGRDLVGIVHHKEYGEIERHRVDVRMLR